jgi:hypothetical protein
MNERVGFRSTFRAKEEQVIKDEHHVTHA